jgi:hypothetical protein
LIGSAVAEKAKKAKKIRAKTLIKLLEAST